MLQIYETFPKWQNEGMKKSVLLRMQLHLLGTENA